MLGSAVFLALLAVCYIAVGIWDYYLSQILYFAAVPGVFVFLSQVVMRYITKQVGKLEEYSQSMSEGGSAVDLRLLFSMRGILLLWIFTAVVIQPFYALGVPRSFTVTQILFTGYIPWLYLDLVVSTFIWVWSYSLFSIYRMGKLPLRLKSFIEDRTLGLRPFGLFTARFTVLFLIPWGYLFLPQFLVGYATPPLTILFGSFFALGFVFFLLPLRPLRTKLHAARAEELKWLVPRYKSILQHLQNVNTGSADSALIAELNAIDKIQRDVHQIRNWPFDTGIAVRFSAVILSVLTVILARILTIALHL